MPCRNEAATVEAVVRGLREALEHARITVWDDASTDGTGERAQRAGAQVRTINANAHRGKGAVVRAAIAESEADVIVIIDGDATYPANAARSLVDTLVNEQLDMVSGARKPTAGEANPWPTGHRAGNRMIAAMLRILFAGTARDPLTGLRVLTARFARSFPARSDGFTLETELTIHATLAGIKWKENDIGYRARHPASASKLRKFDDGSRIIALAVGTMLTRRTHAPLWIGAGAVALWAAGQANPALWTTAAALAGLAALAQHLARTRKRKVKAHIENEGHPCATSTR